MRCAGLPESGIWKQIVTSSAAIWKKKWLAGIDLMAKKPYVLKDMFGRPFNVGDLVLYRRNDEPIYLRVVDIKKNKIGEIFAKLRGIDEQRPVQYNVETRSEKFYIILDAEPIVNTDIALMGTFDPSRYKFKISVDIETIG